MAYTARQLITFSWYLSGIVSRELETVSGTQINDGLERLNGILASITSNLQLVPFFQEYEFAAVPGQEVYPINGLIQVETLTFNIGPVRYSILPASRETYFATGRVDNISSLPYQWHLERFNGGSNLYLYFLPQEAYPMKLWGKFLLTQVMLDQDLTIQFEEFYIEYLKYKLGRYICDYYNVRFPRSHQETLNRYELQIRNVSPLDLTQQKMSIFQPGAPFNYADVNIGRGWRPVG